MRAFWSVTMDHDRQLFEESIGRYVVGDRDALKFNSDGSLDLYVQRRPRTRRSRELVTRAGGGFTMVLRLYWPQREIIDGRWEPPPVQRVVG